MLLTTEVPAMLIEDIAESCGEAFAVSYLSGATSMRGILMPWTVTAYQRLQRNQQAKAAIERAGLRLEQPFPFGHPSHPASMKRAAA